MLNYQLYNLFQTAHIQSDKYFFECIFDSSKIKKKGKQNTITHIIKPTYRQSYASLIFEGTGRDLLDDYCLLLSVMQGNGIHYGNQNGLPILNFINDPELFLSNEVGSFLNIANSTLDLYHSSNNSLLKVISRGLLLYYEAKYLLIYHESQEIVMMHLFEFLLGSIYRIDNSIPDEDDVRLEESYSYICGKHQYQQYIDQRLRQDLGRKSLSTFKKKRKIKSIESFVKQFNAMRNWIQHGKQTEKPNFDNSPSNLEFTFFFRLENLIRIILSDELGFNDYVRKFDLLYQLIVEKNVSVILTPDVNQLRFVDVK